MNRQLPIAIVGYGTMGKEVHAIAKKQNRNIVSLIDPHAENANAKTITKKSLNGAQVAICFTKPDVVQQNVSCLLQNDVKIVMATTGWDKEKEAICALVHEHDGAMVYSANFSLGVNLFFAIAAYSAKLFNAFADYDPFITETHHRRKLDSPSGTAIQLAQIVLKNYPSKTQWVHGQAAAVKPSELHVSAARGGDVPGEHKLVFDATFDNLEIKHTARSRSGFAAGALYAADFLADKKGVFTEQQLFSF